MKKLKNNKFRIFSLLTVIVLDWISLTAILYLKKKDILPLKFFLPIVLILLLTSGIFSFFIIKKKFKKKTISNKIKIPLTVLSVLEIIAIALALIYVNKAFKFLDTIGDSGYHIETYSVIALKGRYEKIEDLEAGTMKYFKQGESTVDQALQQLEEKISVIKEESNNIGQMVDDLYNNQTDSIMIEESYKSIIKDSYEDFEDKTEILYTIEIKTETESIAKSVNVSKEPFNIFISGIDSYGAIESVARSDVNILATINPKTHQVLLTAIPRDYYVELADTGSYDKLTHAGIYGIDKSVRTVEILLDTEINYYVKVNFSSLTSIVDALGGVEVYSEYSFTGWDGGIFQEGYNRVNGTQALDFVRTRKTVPGGDRTRGVNQEALISAMIEKACSKEILTRYSAVLNSLEGSFQTNMSTDEITKLIKNQINEMAKWNVTSLNLDGYDGRAYTYSYGGGELYVMMPDDDSVADAKQKIKDVINDQVLESSYAANTGDAFIPGHTTPYWMMESYYSEPALEPTPTAAVPEEKDPEELEDPENIEDPENPENIEDPEDPENTEDPETPENPETPEEPVVPEESEGE